MIRLFTGFDRRESVGWQVFAHSVITRASAPVQITALSDKMQTGTNTFTQARFQIPALCNHEGWAIYADGCDMLCHADIAELWEFQDEAYAVQVVKNNYTTNSKIKYVKTDMECPNQDYKRKNWASLMLINCAHPAWIEADSLTDLERLQLAFIPDSEIGDLPEAWNWLCDEYGESRGAKIMHWTQGIPAFAYYHNAPMAGLWHADYLDSQRGYELTKKEAA